MDKKYLIDYTLASYAIKKQFLSIYNLEFNTEIFEKDNICFNIKIFNDAKEISLVKTTNFYKK
ncbi:hypothetical protein [Gemella sp. zg-1178]|uniref:hypothetical protein n=1 Tax=Gemella sp. zg-1178 TaxID=2840372 RepID=UPI001C04CDE8|nr:hypothetical protein [Gemella sp. zg-1178]MBU0279097.1 hypothetical protein [Gemella sp. zg-1178]